MVLKGSVVQMTPRYPASYDCAPTSLHSCVLLMELLCDMNVEKYTRVYCLKRMLHRSLILSY